MKSRLLLFSRLLFTVLLAGSVMAIPLKTNAQQNPITGVVTSSDDLLGLPGVNVLVKGTTIGTTTNSDGKFSINASEGSTLSFSFIGYVTQEVLVTNQTTIDIVLTADINQLDEVVVVGYGEVRKEDLTGSVSSIKSSDLGNRSVTNVGQMLSGRIAGVDAAPTSGGVNNSPNIKIRGTNSLSGTDPLFIINGMIGDANMVNPNDIESIDVLKDASATAIYGAQGANGVIIITTKKGKKGNVQVDYQGFAGVATPSKKLDMLNASQYTDLLYDRNGGTYNPETGHYSAPGGLPLNLYDENYMRTDRTNWQDEMLRNRNLQDHYISVSGASDIANFRVSGGYKKQGEIGGNKTFTQLNLMINSDYKIGKYIRVGESISIREQEYTGNGPDFQGGLRLPPYEPVLSPMDNNYGDFSYVTTGGDLNDLQDFGNPVSTFRLNNFKSEEMKYMINLWAEVDILKDLTFRSQVLYERLSNHELSYQPSYQQGNSVNPDGLKDKTSFGVWPKWENFLTYSLAFGDHNITALVGNYYYKGAHGGDIAVQARGFKNFDIPLAKFGTTFNIAENGSWHEAQLSYYGRLNYIFKNKYLFTFNIRSDGSDKFGPNNRWGTFPSFAAAWKISEESFLQDSEPLSSLKLRASWGKSGSQAISQYQYFTNVFYGGANNVLYPFGDGSPEQFVIGATVNSLANPNIQWETTRTLDIGVDAGLFDNKLSLTVDYYNKFTDGILVGVPIAASTGIDTAPTLNAASVSNKGVDFSVGYNTQINEFQIGVTAVGAYNRNKVESLGKGEPITGGGTAVGNVTRTEVGRQIAYFWGLKTDGVISTQAEANEYNSKFNQNLSPGDLRFKDLNGDGKIDSNDRTDLGAGMPAWTYGANFSIVWRSFDLMATFQGTQGNKGYNVLNAYVLNGMARVANGTTDLLNRWQQEGDITSVPRATDNPASITNNTQVSDRYVEDASYLRFQTLTVGYTLPKSLITGKWISRARIYFTGENLQTWTDYTGYMPGVYQDNNLGRGVDGGNIPLPRNFIGGVQLSF